MARIGPKNSRPELIVRRLLYAQGYRFRLHRRDLPGTPDIIFSARSKVIFVHGCFWHRHPGCRLASTPQTRSAFWREKFSTNTARDQRVIENLMAAGWSVLIVWGCETRALEGLANKLQGFLGPARRAPA